MIKKSLNYLNMFVIKYTDERSYKLLIFSVMLLH